MTVLSLDLAACSFRDIGIAILRGTPTSAEVELVMPREHGLEGIPDVRCLVHLCVDLAVKAAAGLILADGPQAWRASCPEHDHDDMRVCER